MSYRSQNISLKCISARNSLVRSPDCLILSLKLWDGLSLITVDCWLTIVLWNCLRHPATCAIFSMAFFAEEQEKDEHPCLRVKSDVHYLSGMGSLCMQEKETKALFITFKYSLLQHVYSLYEETQQGNVFLQNSLTNCARDLANMIQYVSLGQLVRFHLRFSR